MGGQFNVQPGRFSEYVMNCMVESGADAVIASHPHIVQKTELKGNTPCAFSLGNISMSMSTPYIIRDDLPDYGLMLHFYLESKKIQKVTYSLIKMEENEKGYLFVSPVSELFKQADCGGREKLLKDAQHVVQRVTGNKNIILNDIMEEFELFTL